MGTIPSSPNQVGVSGSSSFRPERVVYGFHTEIDYSQLAPNPLFSFYLNSLKPSDRTQSILKPHQTSPLRQQVRQTGDVRAQFPREPRIDDPIKKKNIKQLAISLHRAVKRNQHNLVIDILDNAILLDVPRTVAHTPDKLGNTPLFYACWYDSRKILDIILTKVPGVRVNRLNNNGWSPLHACCFMGRLRCLQFLVTTSRRINFALPLQYNITSKKGWSPIFVACLAGHTHIINFLLSLAGVNPNSASSEGVTPLLLCTEFGLANCVSSLLRHKDIHLTKESITGDWPFYVAVKKNYTIIARLLLECQLFRTEKFKKSKIEVKKLRETRKSENKAQIQRDDRPLAQTLGLLPNRDQSDENVMSLVDALNFEPELTEPDTSSSKFRFLNQKNRSQIVKPILQPELNIFEALATRPSPEEVKKMKERNELRAILASYNQINRRHKLYGDTPLLLACKENRIECLSLMLRMPNIDVNKADNKKTTPIGHAVMNDNATAVALFLHHPDTKINVSNNAGDTPLTLAVKYQTLECINLLLLHPRISINSSNRTGSNSVFLAIENSSLEILDCLLAHPRLNLVNSHRFYTQAQSNKLHIPVTYAAELCHINTLDKLLPSVFSRSHPNTNFVDHGCFFDGNVFTRKSCPNVYDSPHMTRQPSEFLFEPEVSVSVSQESGHL